MPANQSARRRRRVNGDGSVYKRGDGYWVGVFYASTTAGARKRVVVYGKTLDEARDKLLKAMQQARSGIPVPDESWKLGAYLEYWLENVVKPNRRPATYALYETIIRLYLVPGLGAKSLARLSVPAVQMFLNQRIEAGDSIRKVQVMRSVLSAALSRAVREELVTRNVARHVELPEWRRNTIRPWTVDEANRFMAASMTDPLHSAFVLLILYGLRRGEVLGLSWSDIDSETGTIHVRQQIQRIRGELQLGPVKTHAGRRTLPLLDLAAQALAEQADQQARLPGRHGLGLAGNRPGFHHPDRPPGRAAQLRPVLPAHLRQPRHTADQGPPHPAHRRLDAERPACPCPRRPGHPGAHPDQHDAGDLHRHRRRGQAGRTHAAAWHIQ
jgi:integrase